MFENDNNNIKNNHKVINMILTKKHIIVFYKNGKI
jgi:hypothetical protein